jgi:thiamine biosynthesis lipoprotein
MAITLNSLAQGYITDAVADLLRNEGFESAVVDLGGLHARPPSDGSPAPYPQRHGGGRHRPRQSSPPTWRSRSPAATSTTFESTGRFHHIFDPHTGASANALIDVAVIGPRATAPRCALDCDLRGGRARADICSRPIPECGRS